MKEKRSPLLGPMDIMPTCHICLWNPQCAFSHCQDATGTVIRWWIQKQTNQGMLNMELMLADQPAYGTWTIRVDGFVSLINCSHSCGLFLFESCIMNNSCTYIYINCLDVHAMWNAPQGFGSQIVMLIGGAVGWEDKYISLETSLHSIEWQSQITVPSPFIRTHQFTP